MNVNSPESIRPILQDGLTDCTNLIDLDHEENVYKKYIKYCASQYIRPLPLQLAGVLRNNHVERAGQVGKLSGGPDKWACSLVP